MYRRIVISLICFALVAARADADDPVTVAEQLTLVNHGEHTIVRMYWVPTVLQLLLGNDEWGKNVLSEALSPGQNATFTITRNGKAPQCKVNVKLAFSDGSNRFGRSIDTCKLNRLVSDY